MKNLLFMSSLLPLCGMVTVGPASAFEPGSSGSDTFFHRLGLLSLWADTTGTGIVGSVVKVGALVGGVVLVAGALLLLLEKKLIYHPVRYPGGDWSPEGLEVEDCSFTADDGVRLHGWWHDPDGEAPVLLWFHGNAGNITYRADNMRMLAEEGIGFLIVSYRGYGKSEGRPSEEGLYRDGEAAHRYLAEERGVAPERIVCFGRSLGAAVALHVSLEKPTRGLIMESPFASVTAMARKILPLLPLWPLVRADYDNRAKVSSLQVPLLLIHGSQDSLVPLRQGRAVFEAAPHPKEFYLIQGAGHNDTYLVGGRPYFEKLKQFCTERLKQDG